MKNRNWINLLVVPLPYKQFWKIIIDVWVICKHVKMGQKDEEGRWGRGKNIWHQSNCYNFHPFHC